MNKNIASLFRSPRGTPWRSRLTPFHDEIRRWRDSGDSYRVIADRLAERGLVISIAAIHGFVKARARQKQPQFCLPKSPVSLEEKPTYPDLSSTPAKVAVTSEAPTMPSRTVRKEYVYLETSQEDEPLDADDFKINDPFNGNTL